MRHVSFAATGTCAFVVIAALAARAVRADEPTPMYGSLSLEVEVGETASRAVGFALGLRCDDLSIAQVDLRPGTPDSNVFVVTGVKPGATTCRVGTVPNRPSYLYQVRVVPSRHRN